MESWEQDSRRILPGWVVILTLIASAAMHALLLWWATRWPIAIFSREYFDQFVPRTFRLERAEIDPRLLEPDPAEEKSQALVPEPVALPEEHPELGAAATADARHPIAPPPSAVRIEESPASLSPGGSSVAEADGALALPLDELAIVERPPPPELPAPDVLAVEAGGGASLPDKGKTSTAKALGFSNLDELLALTGPLSPNTAPILLPADILFDYDSSALRPEAEESLRKLGTLIQRNPRLRFLIEGHTDSFGSEEYNLELSTRRARTVRDWLETTMGIAPERLGARGLGKSRLIAPGSGSIEDQRINRRVEIVILPEPSEGP